MPEPLLISVIIPSYNRQDYVAQTVESVLGQSYPHFEIIVVDDGSTDETGSLLAQYRGLPNFRYVRQENQGRSAARNHGIRLARGDYLLFLDSDDLLAPGALERLQEAAAREPGAGLIMGLVDLVDGEGRPLDPSDGLSGPRPPRRGLLRLVASRTVRAWQFEPGRMPRPPRLAYSALMEGEQFMMGSGLILRRLVDRIGPFDAHLEPCEDADFHMRAALDCDVAYVESTVLRYRRHGSNTPGRQFKTGGVRLFKKHLALLGGRQDLPAGQRRHLKSLCLFNLGNRYYALDRTAAALYHYLLGVVTRPSILARRGVALQCLKGLVPTPLRRRARGTI